MKIERAQLERLLRAAASVPNEPPEMPFGFDSRVLAHWRATRPADSLIGVTRLLRRVVLTAVALIVLASAGAYREMTADDEPEQNLSNNDAIADSAIGAVFEK